MHTMKNKIISFLTILSRFQTIQNLVCIIQFSIGIIYVIEICESDRTGLTTGTD